MTEIILISGSAGTGKTTIARLTCCKLSLSHRIGTGFIREVLRSTTNIHNDPELFTFTFRPTKQSQLIKNFEDQSKKVCKAVNSIISRAEKEGTSIVIEGNHLLPQFLNLSKITKFFVLKGEKDHIAKQIVGDTHAKRKITSQDIENILTLQDYIIKKSKQYGITATENICIVKTVNTICTTVRRQFVR